MYHSHYTQLEASIRTENISKHLTETLFTMLGTTDNSGQIGIIVQNPLESVKEHHLFFLPKA